MSNIATADDGPPPRDRIMNYYRECERVYGLKRDAAARLIGTAGVSTFVAGRERFVRESEFARIPAILEAAEAARRGEAA